MEDIELVPNGTLTLPQIFSPLPMYAAWPCCFAYRVYAGSCRESSFSQDVNAINYREEEIVGCILLPGPVPRPYTDGAAIYPGTCRHGLAPGRGMRSLRVRVPDAGEDVAGFERRARIDQNGEERRQRHYYIVREVVS